MIKIEEGKQVGVLYHYTSLDSILSILKTNMIDGQTRGYISFTRDKNFLHVDRLFIKTLDSRLVIDGDKLSERYRLEPYNYFDRHRNLAPYELPMKNLEAEDRVVGTSVKDAKKFIMRVEILASVHKSDPHWIDAAQGYRSTIENSYGIPCVIV